MRERVLYVHTLGGRHRWVSMICSGGLHRKMQCLVLFFMKFRDSCVSKFQHACQQIMGLYIVRLLILRYILCVPYPRLELYSICWQSRSSRAGQRRGVGIDERSSSSSSSSRLCCHSEPGSGGPRPVPVGPGTAGLFSPPLASH